MKNTILETNSAENKIKKAEKYVLRYLNELKIHFTFSDEEISKVLQTLNRRFKKKSNKNTPWWKNIFIK